MNILSVPCWEAAARKAAWERQLWERGLLHGTDEDQNSQGLQQSLQGQHALTGQLSYPSPCTAEKRRPSARGLSLAPSYSSLLSGKASRPVLGWSLNAAQLPKPLTDRCSYKKKKIKGQMQFSLTKQQTYRHRNFLWVWITAAKYYCESILAMSLLQHVWWDRTASSCPDWASSYTEVNLGQIHKTPRINNMKSGTEREDSGSYRQSSLISVMD